MGILGGMAQRERSRGRNCQDVGNHRGSRRCRGTKDTRLAVPAQIRKSRRERKLNRLASRLRRGCGAGAARGPFPGHAPACGQQDSSQQPRRARQMQRRTAADEPGEDIGEQQWTDDAGQADQTGERALHATLRVGADLTGDQGLRGRCGNGPQRTDRHTDQEGSAAVGQPIDDEADHPAAQPQQQRAAFAEPAHQAADQQRIDDDAADTDPGQYPAHFARAPMVLVTGEQHENAGIDVMRQVGQEHHRRQAEHLRVAAQQFERAQRIGVRPVQPRGAALGGQRFGQHEPAIQHVQQGKPGGKPERPAQPDAAQPTADQRAGDKADAEGGTKHAECAGAFVRWGDIGDVGIGGGEAGRAHAGDDPRQQQHRQAVGNGHQDEVQAQAKAREQDHRAATEAVGERALQRRADELDGSEQEAEPADPAGGHDVVATGEVAHQIREYRNDDPEGQHVDQDGDEDEDQRGAAAPRDGSGIGREGHRAAQLGEAASVARDWVVDAGGTWLLGNLLSFGLHQAAPRPSPPLRATFSSMKDDNVPVGEGCVVRALLSPEREGTAGAPLARVPWNARTVGAAGARSGGWGEGTGKSHRNDSECTRLRTHPHPPYGHLPSP
ncbi:hypothetical protein XAC2852_900004 [Xanthomonas citri pv. citri]|nr:hypothetical protein XAC2852_900004 [Xanthomonas citri pv. citri]